MNGPGSTPSRRPTFGIFSVHSPLPGRKLGGVAGARSGISGSFASPSSAVPSVYVSPCVPSISTAFPPPASAFFIAMVILLAELRLRHAEISGLVGGSIGVVLGLLVSLLITLVVSRTSEPESAKSFHRVRFAALARLSRPRDRHAPRAGDAPAPVSRASECRGASPLPFR